MYLYDMMAANLDKAKESLKDNDGDIIFVNAGVTNREQSGSTVMLKNEETSVFALGSDNEGINPETMRTEEDKIEVKLVALDDDIKEKITFLKMDIEGSEMNALEGARNHIVNEHPKLAICTYHHYEDLWMIPEYIMSLDPSYKIYLRYNGENYGIMASEHVMIAV